MTPYERILVEVRSLNLAELYALNKEVVDAIKYNQKRTARRLIEGQRVSFTSSRTGATVTGNIVKVNSLSVKVAVETPMGLRTFNVTPSLLNVIG